MQKYQVDVEDYNDLLNKAYSAIGKLNWRLGESKKFQQAKAKEGFEGEELQARLDEIDKAIDTRADELQVIWDLLDSGNRVLQELIDQKTVNWSQAYDRGYKAALRSSLNGKMVNDRWDRESYRAKHELNALRSNPDHY